MAESHAERAARLATPTGFGGAGGRPAPPPQRTPQRLAAVPQHTPAQMQAFVQMEQEKRQVEMEQAKAQAQKLAAGTPDSFADAMSTLQQFTGGEGMAMSPQTVPAQDGNPAYVQLPQAPTQDPTPEAKQVAPPEEKPAGPVSSFDLEVLEMSEDLDVGELMTNGYVFRELEIVPGFLTVSVRSLKRSDRVEIRKDIDAFRRGAPVDPNKPDGDWITPFPDAVMDYANLRQLAAGVLGINGVPLVADWMQRAAELEDRVDAEYEAIKREYAKFLAAVNLLYPDKPTKEVLDKLRERLGKVPAHP